MSRFLLRRTFITGLMPARLGFIMPIAALVSALALGVPVLLQHQRRLKPPGAMRSPRPSRLAEGAVRDDRHMIAVVAPRGASPAVFDVKAIAQFLAATSPSPSSPRRGRKQREIARLLATLREPALDFEFEPPGAAVTPKTAQSDPFDLLPPPAQATALAASRSAGATAPFQVDPSMPANKLKFDTGPGTFSPLAGVGEWNGAPAAAMGAGYTLPDGKTRFGAAGVTNVNGVSALQTMPKSFGLSAVATIALP